MLALDILSRAVNQTGHPVLLLIQVKFTCFLLPKLRFGKAIASETLFRIPCDPSHSDGMGNK